MPHILLVEDDREFAGLITLFLEKQEIKVTHVCEAEGVITLLCTTPVDLIIMDIGLVKM
ncbi:MAG TPA: response regulator transcription factor, partial [Epsilonproteobacteria bacterium]|nr:response regulator transcription factor [Campylobacterota bacterium]